MEQQDGRSCPCPNAVNADSFVSLQVEGHEPRQKIFFQNINLYFVESVLSSRSTCRAYSPFKGGFSHGWATWELGPVLAGQCGIRVHGAFPYFLQTPVWKESTFPANAHELVNRQRLGASAASRSISRHASRNSSVGRALKTISMRLSRRYALSSPDSPRPWL